jgi:predicted lipoprotein with Yx(FWY)xxD motif
VPRLNLACLAAVAFAGGCGGDPDPSKAPATDNRSVPVADDAAVTAEPASRPRKGAVVKVVDSQFGRVLADRRGEALYLFNKETRRRSECYGGCAVVWPPVLAKGKPRAGAGARQRMLGTTRRRNGRLQVTYAGQPLYYFQNDSPGRILCHNVDEFGGLWLVVKPNGSPVG